MIKEKNNDKLHIDKYALVEILYQEIEQSSFAILRDI